MTEASRSVSVPPVPPARSERSPGVKLVIAVLIAVALMVPLLMIYGLLWDRQQQAQTAQASIGQGWGGQQTIAGPVIVIPYRATETNSGDREWQGRHADRQHDPQPLSLAAVEHGRCRHQAGEAAEGDLRDRRL